MDDLLKPKDLADTFSIPVSTVRYYIKLGLLLLKATHGGHARLRDNDVDTTIKQAFINTSFGVDLVQSALDQTILEMAMINYRI